MRPSAAPSLSETDCLDALMRLRFGSAPCKACGGRSFERESRNRAFSCRSCGMKVFPCQGTPFAKPRPPLSDWFRAVDLAARGEVGPRPLRTRIGLDRRTAAETAAAVARLKAASAPDPTAGWFPEIAAFVAERQAAVPAPPPSPERETPWESLRALISLPQVERRPVLGSLAIGLFMLAGAGIGWLFVPQAPESNEELAQATAILSLGEQKPIILVTEEVGALLYDVTDVDADPNSPLASSIRIAPRLDPAGAATALSEAKPAAPPAVKLSAGAGQSLVDGNTDAVKASARDRPELAVYGALASELEGKGPRNPDELLTFGPMRIRRYLVEKIVRASRATTVDPVLLMAIADKESSFKTEVQAQTSSASGLYQFIEKTWLGVVRDFGPRYGLEKEAALVSGGDLARAERQRILDMRRDPYISAVFAAEMLKRDSLRIARRIGRNLTGGEVYLVHFLGPDGAERMIDEVSRKPDTMAASLLPRPAAANKPIFYGAGSKSLSVAEVRGKFESMISLRLDRYRAVKAVPVPNAAEPRSVPVAEGR
jgi:hypothetical protein